MLEPKKIIEVFIFHEIDWNSYGLQYIELFFQLIFFFTFQNCPRAVYADKQHTEGGGSAQPGPHPLHPGAEG